MSIAIRSIPIKRTELMQAKIADSVMDLGRARVAVIGDVMLGR
jgi:hypothetical protein